MKNSETITSRYARSNVANNHSVVDPGLCLIGCNEKQLNKWYRKTQEKCRKAEKRALQFLPPEFR